MALPELHYRGDIIVMVAWDPAAPETWVNFCGAEGGSLTIDNAVQEKAAGDCNDWGAPIKNILSYGAQSVTMNLNASLARSQRDKLLLWAKDQLSLPVRIHIVDAPVGETEYIDGIGMLPSLNIEGLGNVTNEAITTTLNIRFKNGVDFTEASA